MSLFARSFHALRQRFAPRWLVLVLDLGLVTCALLAATLLRFDFRVPHHEWMVILDFFPVFLGLRFFTFRVMRTHAGIIRHTGSADALRVFWSVTLGSVAFAALNFFTIQLGWTSTYWAPFSVLAIEWLGSVVCLIAMRLMVKWIYMSSKKFNGEMIQVAIYGAGEAGMMAKRALDRDLSTARMRPTAYIDDDPGKVGKKLEGIDILSSQEAQRLFQSGRVSRLILAIRNLPLERRREMVDMALAHGIRTMNVPPIEQWIGGELSAGQLRELNIEDLLGRPSIRLDENRLMKFVAGRRVAVTGAAGSIGRECVRQLMMHKPESILAIDQAETPMHDLMLEMQSLGVLDRIELQIGDIRDGHQVDETFAMFRPHVVIHAAAYKHVPMMERQPWQAFETNVVGTLNVLESTIACEASAFIQVSTDKAVNPSSVMGATKRLAELLVMAHQGKGSTRLMTTRFGNVLGSNGSVIPLFRSQIAAGGPVTVTDSEMTRYFMTIPEAVSLILEAGAMGEGGEVFLFDMGEAVRILDLAEKMISLSGFRPGQDIVVEITGIRPGEKLHEELSSSHENHLPTHHKKIMRVAHKATVPHDLIHRIRVCAKDRANHDAAVNLLAEIIPEYKTKNLTLTS